MLGCFSSMRMDREGQGMGAHVCELERRGAAKEDWSLWGTKVHQSCPLHTLSFLTSFPLFFFFFGLRIWTLHTSVYFSLRWLFFSVVTQLRCLHLFVVSSNLLFVCFWPNHLDSPIGAPLKISLLDPKTCPGELRTNPTKRRKKFISGDRKQ